MKKMLIAMVSAIALMVSVIGCQVYDSQTNDILYSGMNLAGEGTTSKEAYLKKFNDACLDLSADEASVEKYDIVLDFFFGYDVFYTAVLGVVADDNTFTGDSTKSLYDKEQVKEYWKTKWASSASIVSNIRLMGSVVDNNFGEYLVVNDVTLSLLYDALYELKWDWNSKKGR